MILLFGSLWFIWFFLLILIRRKFIFFSDCDLGLDLLVFLFVVSLEDEGSLFFVVELDDGGTSTECVGRSVVALFDWRFFCFLGILSDILLISLI